MKQLALILAVIVALDHLLLDAVLFENATEKLLGERKRLF
jgi:hypothetical protein